MSITTELTPSRTEVLEGVLAEYHAFADLVAALTDAEWATPTRCTGFDVRDVAGHVIGLAEDVAAGKAGSRTAELEAASVRDDPPATAAARLTTALTLIEGLVVVLDDDAVWDGPSPVDGLSMAEAVLTLWYDTYVHADDIRAALGRPTVPGPGERATLAYLAGTLASRGFGPQRFELTPGDHPPVEIGVTDGSAPTCRIAPHDLILAATGRIEPGPLGLDPAVNIYAG
jgi:uncharacterized protein (TIGR03083 family)